MLKMSASTLNPFAVSYVPLAKREAQLEDRHQCMTISWKASVDDLKLKEQQEADDAQNTRAEGPQEMVSDVMDEESEMDLAYLQMTFPDISDQFLADVYNVTRGDVDAAVDMLSELESTDDQQNALDIDDTLESDSFGECSSVKAVSLATVECESITSPGCS